MTLYEIDRAVMACVSEETGEIIEDAMEELELDNIQKAENVALAIKNDTAMARALKEEIDNLTQRLRVCNNGIDSKKKYLPYLLGDKKLKTSRVSISYRKSESVAIDDLTSLAEEYIRIPEPQADKTAIKRAIKAGEKITGAHLEQTRSVIIK